ncbi:MAG: endonuclease MutS2 [Chloroflexota bacterium]
MPELKEKSLEEMLVESMRRLEFFTALEFISKYAITDPGREILLNLRPSEDIERLNEEHSTLDEAVKLLVTEDSVPFEGMDDVRQRLYSSLVINSVLSSLDILKIADVARVSRLLKGFFASRFEKFPLLSERAAALFENRLLEKHIAEALTDTGEVKDTASKELFRIRQEIHGKSARLRSRIQKIMRKVALDDMTRDEFITIREGRYVLPIRSEHKRHLPGIIHGISQTGATVFIEPSEIIEMNNELSILSNEEQREVYKILRNLTAEIGDDAKSMLASVEIMAYMDSLLARARYALEYGGVKPEISDENEIILKNVKHPLLVHTKGKDKVIPLSVEFSPEKRGHLISGPNAGGKTVALKSVGLSVLMALSGIFPLGYCKTNYRTVFTSIGDNQSIENDLSTFSSQALQLIEILRLADNRSLALIDEILSGTDPQEGSALAAGILDTFLELNLFFVVTTHQSSLKSYALNRSEIENASLEFDEKQLKPTFKFLSGIPGNSYAFFLAQNLGMSPLVLERSKKYLGERHQELEESIRLLQKYKSEAETDRAAAQSERAKFNKLKSDYDEKLKSIKTKRRETLDQANREALEIVRGANSLIENTIKELREEKRSIAEVKHDYGDKRDKIEEQVRKSEEKAQQAAPRPKGEVVEGEGVLVIDSNATGIALEVDKAKGVALVDLNGLKFRLPLSKLAPAEKKETKKADYTEFIKFDMNTRLDLRGKRAEESLRELEDYISNAILNNVPMFTIIHGKGTGALRKAIHEFLTENPYIKSFREGELTEGGAGVTIVEF